MMRRFKNVRRIAAFLLALLLIIGPISQDTVLAGETLTEAGAISVTAQTDQADAMAAEAHDEVKSDTAGTTAPEPDEAAASQAASEGSGTAVPGPGETAASQAVSEGSGTAETEISSAGTQEETQPAESEERTSETAAPGNENSSETETEAETSESMKSEVLNAEAIEGSSTAGGVTVYVSAPVGSFPEGTTLKISPLAQATADAMASEILQSAEVAAFDISFFSAEGERVQPIDGKSVKVTFTTEAASDFTEKSDEEATLQVYHIDADSQADQLTSVPAPEDGAGAKVSVEATQFSTYMILKSAQNRAPQPAAAGGVDAGAHVHCTVTTENTSVSNGQYVSFAVSYKIDHGTIHENDYITVTIPDSLKNVDLQLDPKHFKGYEKQADGSYHLIFNDNADGIAGSFSLNVTASNDSTSAVTATVDVNGAKCEVTIAGQTPSGTGIGKAVEKSAFDGSSIQYGGYDYSTGAGVDATEVGIYTPSSDVVANFHIDVNHNGQELWNAVVTDEIPVSDSVIYNNDLQIGNLNGAAYTNHSSANHISVSFGHLSADQRPRLTYSVTIKAGTKLKITNNAVFSFTSVTGENETVIDSFQMKPGNGYSAADAYKSVDKTVVSSDPEDQTVKYTITFDPDKEFAAGQLQIADALNEHVKYLYAYGDSAFDVSYDAAAHTVNIVNNQTVDGSRKRTVTIVTDFSDVPEGMDVTNTVGNTVHTLKYKGELEIRAKKTVDGGQPGSAVFQFQLLDEGGQVLQTKENNAQGEVAFDPIHYGKDDLNREHIYTVKESSEQSGYTKDDTVYTIKVTPTDDNQDGILEIHPEIIKEGQAVTEIAFDNKTLQGSLKITKSILGDLSLDQLTEDQKKVIEFEVTGPGQYTKTFTLADMETGSITLTNLVPGQYTVKETKAEIPGYIHEVRYSTENGETAVSAGNTAEMIVTNTYTQEKISIPVTKKWVGEPAAEAKVELLADGTAVKSETLTADKNWTVTFEELPRYDSKDGHEIVYTLSEVKVPGYSTVITGDAATGFTVTNTITGKVSVGVTKKWVGPAADSVTVKLMNGEKEVASQVLNAGNGWQYTFTDLEKYNEDGSEIVYTLSEVKVPGYSTVITGDAATGFTVTNTNTAKLSIPVTKKWVGEPAAKAEVELLADGTAVRNETLTADKNWTVTFEELPKYDSKDGHEIVYTVSEKMVEGYTTVITGDAQSGFTVVNTKKNEPKKPGPSKPGNPGKSGSSGSSPRTGDSSNIALFAAMMAISFIVLVMLLAKRSKREKR